MSCVRTNISNIHDYTFTNGPPSPVKLGPSCTFRKLDRTFPPWACFAAQVQPDPGNTGKNGPKWKGHRVEDCGLVKENLREIFCKAKTAKPEKLVIYSSK